MRCGMKLSMTGAEACGENPNNPFPEDYIPCVELSSGNLEQLLPYIFGSCSPTKLPAFAGIEDSNDIRLFGIDPHQAIQ